MIRHVLFAMIAVAACRADAATLHPPTPSVLAGPYGYGPAPVYGFGVPSYRWGWFGAEYRPRKVYHWSYYGDYHEWGYRRGY